MLAHVCDLCGKPAKPVLASVRREELTLWPGARKIVVTIQVATVYGAQMVDAQNGIPDLCELCAAIALRAACDNVVKSMSMSAGAEALPPLAGTDPLPPTQPKEGAGLLAERIERHRLRAIPNGVCLLKAKCSRAAGNACRECVPRDHQVERESDCECPELTAGKNPTVCQTVVRNTLNASGIPAAYGPCSCKCHQGAIR